MQRFTLFLVAVTFSLVFAQPYQGHAQPSEQPNTVKLTVVKFSYFEKTLKAQEGKVVLVYLWGDYSVADRKCLGDVVKIHEQLVNQPVTFMTVCHSPLVREDPKQLEKRCLSNLEFLKKMRAGFQNFLLDEDDEVWRDKLGFYSGPTLTVYDQRGKLVERLLPPEGGYRLADIEGIVKKLVTGGAKSPSN